MKLLIAVLCVIGVTFAEQSSPLFMWNVNSVLKPALTTVSKQEFVELVRPYLVENALIIFLEKKLTNKDFLCANTATSKSCFARLQGVPGKTYYPSVNRPLETLGSLTDIRDYITVDQSGQLSSPLEIEKGKIIFVNFEDNLSERSVSLELHDKIMATITNKLEDSNVIFAYTSEESTSKSVTLSRERRDTAAPKSGYVFRKGAEFLLYFSSLFVIENDAKTEIKIDSMDVTTVNKTAMSVSLKGSKSITFDVTLSGGYFFMKNVKLGDVVFRSTDIYSPTDFSYFCGNLTLYSSGSQMLKINSLQFQAPFNSTTNDKFVFGDPWHCVGFFSSGILSGLLVVALLLSISFVGVCWMMDINTMDRFDDPKGKTITINASE